MYDLTREVRAHQHAVLRPSFGALVLTGIAMMVVPFGLLALASAPVQGVSVGAVLGLLYLAHHRLEEP